MKAAVLLVGLMLAFSGCGGQSFVWTKTWIGNRGMKPKPGEDAAALGSVDHIQITIRDDGTYTMDDGGMPIEGQAIISADTVKLKPDRVLGVSAARSGPPYSKPAKLLSQKNGTAVFTREGTTEGIVLTAK